MEISTDQQNIIDEIGKEFRNQTAIETKEVEKQRRENLMKDFTSHILDKDTKAKKAAKEQREAQVALGAAARKAKEVGSPNSGTIHNFEQFEERTILRKGEAHMGVNPEDVVANQGAPAGRYEKRDYRDHSRDDDANK